MTPRRRGGEADGATVRATEAAAVAPGDRRSSSTRGPPNGRSGRSWRPLWPYLLVFGVALGLRLVYLLQIRGELVATLLLGDSEGYDLWAREIAGGDWLGGETFYQAPLYPYFLAIVYRVGGSDPFAARVVQVVVGSIGCALLVRAGELLLSRATGVVAGLLLAVSPLAIYFDGLLQKTVLDSFLLIVLVVVLATAIHLGREPAAPPGKDTKHGLRALWLSAGMVLALLVLVRENALVLVPILLLWLLWARPTGARLACAAAFVVGLALVLAPVGARNLVVGGSFHLTTFQLGSNLYIGNNPAANGTYVPLVEGGGSWRRERADAVRLAEEAMGRQRAPAEVSAYWTRRTVDYVRSEPMAWLRLMARKWLLVWNRVELGDTESIYLFATSSPLLRGLLPVWNLGVLCPLATFGAVLTWRRRRLWIFHAFALALAASVALFFVFARYRFSLVPLLVLFAAAGLTEVTRIARAPRRLVVAALATAAAVAVVSNWKLVREEEILAEGFFNLAVALESRGEQAAAERLYGSALAAYPRFPSALNNLGSLLAREGDLAAAKESFSAAVAIDPEHPNSRLNLGRAFLAEGNPGEAVVHLEVAAALRPSWAAPRELLAGVLLRLDRPAEAARVYGELARLYPGPAAHNNLGTALAFAGQFDEAIASYRAALRLDPSFTAAHDNLASTYLRLGDVSAAVAHLRESARLQPGSHQAQARLQAVSDLQRRRE